jgi:beta-glucanase (GH16 family)
MQRKEEPIMHRETVLRMRKLALTFVVGLAGCVIGLVGTPLQVAAAVGAPPAGFTLTWSDDFTGAANTGVNTSAWKYDTGAGSTFGTGEIETMTNSTANVYQDGAGHLVMKAIHTGTNPTSGWTSGRIETQAATFGAPAGGVVRMESVLQQPNVNNTNGLGYWPAFWMLGAPLRSGVAWPLSGEVDILEDVNGLSREYGTVHCGTATGGPCNETSGRGSGAVACNGCQTGYHDYAVEIDRSMSPERIRWYLDGNNFFTLLATAVDASTWASAVDHPFFIIYDLAMGGGFPNGVAGFTTPTTATVSGASMNIDWVAVYNKGGSTPTPTPTAKPTPTPTPAPGGTLLSQGHPVTCSSIQGTGTPCASAVDGNTGTRWSSASSDPQWIYVDLGATHSINKVALNWEAAYAKAFQIQTSNDAATWTSIYSTTTGTGGVQTLTVSGSGRYVRMYGTTRATVYGYSLWEYQVFGS